LLVKTEVCFENFKEKHVHPVHNESKKLRTEIKHNELACVWRTLNNEIECFN